MTKEEAIKFLSNTKVYVKDKSEEIQKKLFDIGFKWKDAQNQEVENTDKPFIFVYENKQLTHSGDVKWFYNHPHKEFTIEDILNITIEPKYRPFKDADECWNEMQKHQPFGWIKSKCDGSYNHYKLITEVLNSTTIGKTTDCVVGFNDDTLCYHYMVNLCDNYTFADGTPFGIKED